VPSTKPHAATGSSGSKVPVQGLCKKGQDQDLCSRSIDLGRSQQAVPKGGQPTIKAGRAPSANATTSAATKLQHVLSQARLQKGLRRTREEQLSTQLGTTRADLQEAERQLQASGAENLALQQQLELQGQALTSSRHQAVQLQQACTGLLVRAATCHTMGCI
jgi:hypothetical protein